ncbi:Hypothetical predicted protein [Cloeon dipterum]|uniref:Uncharacterized protein n=1 Tax=Cloeon dipterum TaxID=197152 RepID=A0A8S1DSS6_9INSE|nr:Hypothetical predicted protein [Cloeon dipterum]
MASSSQILSRTPNFLYNLEEEKKGEKEEIGLAEWTGFKNVSCSSEFQKQKYLESFRFINNAFPFFIKQIHHDMGTFGMRNGQGEYWGHAIHFLLSNKAHGFPLWNEFEEQMRSEDASFSCKPHVSAQTTNSTFEHYFKISANNFYNALDILKEHSKGNNMALRKRNFLFNPDFWRGPHEGLKLFGNSNEQLVRVQDLTNEESGEQLSMDDDIEELLNELIKHDEACFKDVDFAVLKQNCGFLKSLHKLRQATNEYQHVVSIKEDERGILVQTSVILNTYIEYFEALYEVAAWIVNSLRISPKTFVNDFILHNNFNPEYVHLAIEDFEKSVIDLQARWEYLKKRSIQHRTTLNKLTTLQVSGWKLQKRILDIVLNCVHTHLQIVNFENQKDDVLRDWQVVQYLLPCFVASYLNICECDPPVDESFKKWYYNFIDNLIESAVFKSVNFGSEDQKLKYLESFCFINSAFPFFIKKEHHDMASSKMKEGQGEYWGHAIHFLLSNKAHGFPLWNEFEEQMRSKDASFSCKPHVSAETTNSTFEHYFEKSANNFYNALDILTQDSKSGFLKSLHKAMQTRGMNNRLISFKQDEKGIIGDFFTLNAFTEHVEALSEVSSYIVKSFRISPKYLVHRYSAINDSKLNTKYAKLPIDDYEKTAVDLQERCEILSMKSSNLTEYLYKNETSLNSTHWKFQIRILDIVLKCMGTHFKIKKFKKEKDAVLRDWQVVQYLLPCFVASYLNICECDPPVDESFKKWYYNFIDNLIGKNVDLAESPVFKNVKFSSEDQKLKYLESFRFMNSAFPFFIKEEHHAMASSEMEKGQGEYWGHAIHFLLSNKAHGFPLWNEVEEQMRSEDASFSCKPHVSAETTNATFENFFEDLENKYNSFDILTNDFVLVQLPFQPVMLFQWLTSSLINVWNAEHHFTPFYYLPAPKKFKSELGTLSTSSIGNFRNEYGILY